MQQTRQQERTQQTPSQGPVSSQPEPNPSMSDAAGPPPAQLPDPPRPQLAVEKKEPRPVPRLRAVVESQAFKNVLVDEMDMMHARAATLIQASWRGHRLRQKLASQVLAAKAIQEAWRRFSTKRLLRSSRAREASAGAENEADIPYHPPRQVRFQPRDGDAPPAPSLPPPVMENKETQFPSSDSLAPCPSEEGSPRTPAARPGGPCPTRAPEVTFLPHQTLAITIPCPVRLEASGQPCVLAETITSSCLVRVEGDTMARLRPSTPRASKAHVLGPVPPGRSLQTPDGPGQGQTQDHEDTEVPRAQAQLCPAATMTRTQAPVCPAAAMARTPPQACPTASMTRIQGQVCPVASMTRTCTVAVTAKSPAIMYPAALMTRPPAPVYAVAAVPRAPPQACPVATMTRPPPQACPVAAVIRPLPQACPVATTTRPPPQACPVAAVTRPPPQACPVVAVIRPPPQACPVATTTRPPPQACPVAAVTRPPPQACPVAAVTRPPPQACPVAAVTRPPPQACPVAAVTRPPPQARLAAMVTKTPAQLRSVATIFKTLCLTPPAVGSPKCSPQATTPTGVTKNLSPTHLSPPKVVRAMGSERPAAAVLRAPSHSCVATGKAKCPTPPSPDSGFPRAPAEKSRASPQRPVKMDMSQSTGDPPVSRVSSWAKVRAEDECRLQTPTHLKAGTVNVQSHTCLPVHASVPPSQPQMVPAVARGPCQSQPIPGVARGPSQPQPAPGATRGPCQPQLVICQPRPVSGVARGPCQSQPIPRVARGPSQPQPAPGATRGPCQPQLVICQPRPVSGVAKGPYQPQPAPGVMRSPYQPQLVPCQPRPVSGVAKDPCQPQPAPGVTRGLCQPQPALGMTRGPCQPQLVPRQPQPVPGVARGLCQPQPALGVTRGPCQPQPVPRQPQPVPGVASGPCQPQPAPGVVRVPCQVQLAPQVTRTPCQAQVTLCLTRASSQAQLATETTKSHFPAHQAADINKTQSQPHLAGPKASVQACLPLGALSRAKLDDGLARLPPHSHVLGKTTQGPPLAPSDTQGMLVPLLGSAGHPPCHIESWGDSGTTRAPPTHTRSSLCQEEAMALQLASLCAELAAALGTREDLPALLARALSQGEVRAVLAQALSKEASWATRAKPPPHSMLGAALVKALSWGDLGLALCRALSQGDLRAELARAVQDKLADVLSKALTEEERAALSQALCQGELGAVLGPSLSQAGLRTAAKAVGGGETVTPAPLEMDCRGRPPATWGPLRPHPIKVRVPQGRVWGALAVGQPAEPLEELGVGVALEGSPCSSMPTVRAPMAARPAATAHQCPLMLGLSPVQAWAMQPWGDSLGLSLRPSVASDTAPVVPAPPPLWPLPCLWHLLVANGVGPSTSRPATSAGATPSSHKPHVVSRVAPRPRASSGEAGSGAGVVGGAGQSRGSGGRGQGVPSHHPAAICSRTACWCQLSRTTKAAPGLYRSLAARGPQRPPMAREEPPRRPPPSPNHKPPSTGLRETVNTVCPGILKASVGGREPPPQPQRGTAAGRPGVSRSQKCIVPGAARAAFKASLGDRPALPHPRASTARQERGHAWIALSTVPCSQQQATDYAMGKLSRLVAGLPQGSDDGLACSISQGSMACSLDPSNSQSSLQSLSTLSPSSLSVASVAAVDLADSWEILDGEVQMAPRLPGEGAWRLQGHKDTDGGENPDNRRAAPSPQQLAPALEPAPILHHEAASSRVTLSVHWGSENNLAVPLVCNSMSKLEGLSRAPFEQGLVKSLSLGAVVPTRTQPSSPAQQPLASRVAVPSLSHPSVYSRIAPSLAQQYLASGMTPSLSQPGVPKTATASLSHPSVATRLAPSLIHPSVVSAMAYSLAYPSLTSGVAPSLAQPSIAGKAAPSLAQPSIQSGVAPSLAQPSMASGVAPSLAQPSITHRVAPSLAQPSIQSGVAPSLAQPSMASGVAPSLAQPSMASGVAPSLTQPSMVSGVAPSLAQPSITHRVAPSLTQPSMASGMAPSLAQLALARGVTPILAQPSVASGMTPRRAQLPAARCVAPSLTQPSITHRVAPSLTQPSMTSGMGHGLDHSSLASRMDSHLQSLRVNAMAPSRHHPSVVFEATSDGPYPAHGLGSMGRALSQPSVDTGLGPGPEPLLAGEVGSECSRASRGFYQPTRIGGEHPSLSPVPGVTVSAPNLYQASRGASGPPQGSGLSQRVLVSGAADGAPQGAMAAAVPLSWSRAPMAGDVAGRSVPPGMALSHSQVAGGTGSLTSRISVSGAPLTRASVAAGLGSGCSQAPLAKVSLSSLGPSMSEIRVDLPLPLNFQHPSVATIVAPSYQQANALSQDAAMGAATCLGPGAVTHSPRAASAGRMSGLPPGLVMSGVAPSPPPGSVAALRASTAGGLSTAMPGPAVGSAAQALPQGSMLIGLTPRPYQGTLAGEGSAGGPLLSPFAADPVQGHPQALETVGPAWEVPQVSTPLGRASCLGETPELMLFGAAENPALLMPGELEEVQSLGSESSTPSVVLEATPWTLHDPAGAEVAYGPQAPFEEGPPNGPQTPLLGDVGPVSSQAPNLVSHPMAPHQRLSTHWGAPSSHWVAAGGVPVMQPRTMLGSATGHLPVPLGLSQGSGPYVEPRGYPQGVMASTAVPRSPWLACSSTTAPCLHPAPGANIGVLSLSQGPGVPSVASHMPPYPPAAREGANGSLQVDTIARVLQEPASPVQGRSQALGPRKTYRSLPGSLVPEMPRGPRRTLVRPYQLQEQGPSLVQGSPQRPRETQLPVGTPILPIGEAVPGPPISKPAPGARRVSLGYRVSSGSFLRPLPNLPSHQLGSQVSHGVAVPVGHPLPPLTPADAAVAVGCAWGPWDAVGGQVQVAGPRRLGVLLASMQVAEEVRVHAAIVIQAHVRGYLVRRVVEIWHRSATVIQAVWRGHRVRCAIARLQGAVLTVQSLWRGHSARHPCPGLTPPAPCQAAPSGHRCFQACQPHVCGLCRSLSSGLGSPPSVVLLVGSSPRTCHMCGHTWPTRVVQGTGRASAGPNAGPPTLPPPHRAATTIQSAWRGFRTRRKLRQEHMAARTVQATWRGHYTRAHLSTDALLAPGTAWGVPRHVQWPGV